MARPCIAVFGILGYVLVKLGCDLLPDREAATVETWMKTHPGAKVIRRDRARAYAEGAPERRARRKPASACSASASSSTPADHHHGIRSRAG